MGRGEGLILLWAPVSAFPVEAEEVLCRGRGAPLHTVPAQRLRNRTPPTPVWPGPPTPQSGLRTNSNPSAGVRMNRGDRT